MKVAIVMDNGYAHVVECDHCVVGWSKVSGKVVRLTFTKSTEKTRMTYVDMDRIVMIHNVEEDDDAAEDD